MPKKNDLLLANFKAKPVVDFLKRLNSFEVLFWEMNSSSVINKTENSLIIKRDERFKIQKKFVQAELNRNLCR